MVLQKPACSKLNAIFTLKTALTIFRWIGTDGENMACALCKINCYVKSHITNWFNFVGTWCIIFIRPNKYFKTDVTFFQMGFVRKLALCKRIYFNVRKSHFTNWFNFIGASCIIPMVLRKPACSKLNAIFTIFCIYFPQIVWLTLDPKLLLQIWWHDFPSACINIPRDSGRMSYEMAVILNQNLEYTPHILK